MLRQSKKVVKWIHNVGSHSSQTKEALKAHIGDTALWLNMADI